MTVAKVTIAPLKDLKDWFKVTFVSMKNGIGETSTEMLCSGETLRWLRGEIDQALEEKQADYSNYPKNIQNFMKED